MGPGPCSFARMANCLNCGLAYTGNYCPDCGQAAATRRIDGKLVAENMAYLLFRFDRGFWLTWWHMTLRPGRFVREFIAGKRAGAFKPTQYLLLFYTFTLILVGINHLVHDLPAGSVAAPSPDIYESIRNSQLLQLLYWVPFLTLSAFVVFFRSGYNLWEHLVVTGYGIAHLNTLLLITQVYRLFTGHGHILPSGYRWIVLVLAGAYLVTVYASTYQRTYRRIGVRVLAGTLAVALAMTVSHFLSDVLFGV